MLEFTQQISYSQKEFMRVNQEINPPIGKYNVWGDAKTTMSSFPVFVHCMLIFEFDYFFFYKVSITYAVIKGLVDSIPNLEIMNWNAALKVKHSSSALSTCHSL